MQIISALNDVSDGFEALFCDIWGVVHNGVRAFPEAVGALQRYRSAGGRVVLVTNSPRPQTDVIRQMDRIGVARDAYDAVATSGDAAQAGMVAGVVGQKVWHIGAQKDLAFFDEIAPDLQGAAAIQRVPLQQAQGIVCTGLFDDHDALEPYAAEFAQAIERGLKLLCANPDIVVDWGDTRIFCAGALADLYTRMGGTSLYFGKPHAPIYALARARLHLVAGRDIPDASILAIGDGVGTDAKGATDQGLECLFVTGGLAAGEFGPDPDHPDAASLTRWLHAQGQAPRYAMGHMR
jgi:HAD superfamily hydrolase (TIGR01459 family)